MNHMKYQRKQAVGVCIPSAKALVLRRNTATAREALITVHAASKRGSMSFRVERALVLAV